MSLFNSRLLSKPERADPRPLKANARLSFMGSKIYGQGFLLKPAERDALVRASPHNKERIFPFIGGEEVNTSPVQAFHRYVINFGAMPLEEAERWPELLAIVREKVKPERDRLNREQYRKYWWHHGEKRPALYAAIRDSSRCLVNSQVSKHLIFALQPTDRVFSHALFVYPFPHHTHFAVLQSRTHEAWARLLSSSMKTDLRYTATDCFETFPFPQEEPRALIPALESIGQRLYEVRAAHMASQNVGLTKLYNALKDPTNHDPRIQDLRGLHEALDHEVLKAYGWDDIAVPPYEFSLPEDLRWEILDRLFELNRQRSGSEKNEIIQQ